jgi:hypothetical protein
MRFALKQKEAGDTHIQIHMIDTTLLQKPSLIVHSHTMLELYGISLNPKQPWDSARLQTAKNEFLAWGELQATTGVLNLDDLPEPRRATPNTRIRGLLALMSIPSEVSKEKPASPAAQFSKCLSAYHKLVAQLEFHELVCKSDLAWTHESRRSRRNPST